VEVGFDVCDNSLPFIFLWVISTCDGGRKICLSVSARVGCYTISLVSGAWSLLDKISRLAGQDGCDVS